MSPTCCLCMILSRKVLSFFLSYSPYLSIYNVILFVACHCFLLLIMGLCPLSSSKAMINRVALHMRLDYLKIEGMEDSLVCRMY